MKTLYIGDKEIKGLCSYLPKYTVNRALTVPLIDAPILIDLDGTRMNTAKLSKVLKEADRDVICRVANEGKVKSLLKHFDKVVYSGATGDFDIFHLLRLIFSEDNRKKVFKELVRWKPPLRLLMRWIVGNLEPEDEGNLGWIQRIDIAMEMVSDKLVYKMISLIQPNYFETKRFYWKYPRK